MHLKGLLQPALLFFGPGGGQDPGHWADHLTVPLFPEERM